jgi:FkbM family methyltransferase
VPTGVNRGFKWIVGSSTHKCWAGTYESDKQKWMAQRNLNGTNIWDIGANVGFYTMAFSRAIGKSGSVTAFEPFASNVAYLLQHIRINNLRNVTVVQTAVADHGGLISFSLERDALQGKIEVLPTSYRIPCVSIDELIGAGSFPRPALIKIDVEGAEGFVLQGGVTFLGKFRPELWIALHGHGPKKACALLLRELGYKMLRLDGTLISANIDVDEIVAVSAD